MVGNFQKFHKILIVKLFSLDVTFISLSNQLIKELEMICEKYHISINKFVSAKYINEISQLSNNDEDIFLMTKE